MEVRIDQVNYFYVEIMEDSDVSSRISEKKLDVKSILNNFSDFLWFVFYYLGTLSDLRHIIYLAKFLKQRAKTKDGANSYLESQAHREPPTGRPFQCCCYANAFICNHGWTVIGAMLLLDLSVQQQQSVP